MALRKQTLWLDEQTYAALKALAEQRRTRMSRLAEEFILDGLAGIAEARMSGPALPAVRQAIEEALRPQVERLAALLVKVHLEAGIGERLTYVLIGQSFGPEKARQFLDAARTKSIEALRKPLGEQTPAGRRGETSAEEPAS
jgi:hypothetical protein